MKIIVSFLLACTFGSSLAFASSIDEAKEELTPIVFAMDGVNGIGITGCDPETGENSFDPGFVHCIRVYTETKAAKEALLKLYPVGSTYKGYFVTVKYIGVIEPQPRMSAGNGN